MKLMQSLGKLVAVAALMWFGSAGAAELGKDYNRLASPQATAGGDRIEVLEFFFYGCSHCYHLHPQFEAWAAKKPKDVQVTLVPTAFRDSWLPMAHTFYALEALGQREKLHDALYQAWNVQNTDLSDLGRISVFVGQRGVDRKAFDSAYNSFTVQSKVMRSQQMVQGYRIMGTPTLIVDGRYSITGLQPADTIRVLNDVLDMVRKERAAKKH